MNLAPFLIFDGDCADAMAFYQHCLGGKLSIKKIGDSPMEAQMPPHQHHKVAFASLKTCAMEITATDWLHPTRTPKPGNTVAICIRQAKYQELRAIFDKLAVGADPEFLDNLRDMPFGSYGHLADKYGVHWFFQGDKAQP
jgi:PhnB protein